ncbi:MAG: molybdopterin-dependent oxidoreductase [bacterium]|nr:molybdopterin-dependent oxidoreductase [bacterium]
MAPKEPKTLRMEINHRQVSFPEGASVLRVAELNGVYIPSLCSHKDLSPFGSCRMCMVEIDGMRGYPLACDTLAAKGMKVLTATNRLKELRSDILQLILSEHPSSCLICTESVECKTYQGTIRKTGVATGCRSCPNDDQCELQDVVANIGVTDINYPIYYHGHEPENDDPFFGRDYNICILCGRCVRMCQEVRGTGVLAFTHRGPRAKIGTAFGRNHIEAGCEFCGACVDICPTGALADKVSKWDGKPDGSRVSTCPICSLGCQVELHHKGGRLSKVTANLDDEINDGQLCVKGRFSLPELTHHFERATKPLLRKGPYQREVEWTEAVTTVADKLKGTAPEDILMLVSPDLTNESLFAAQRFMRKCLKSGGIDSTARTALAGGPALWSRIFSQPISIRDIGACDRIVAVGLDSRFHFSIVGAEIRKALRQGGKLAVIDPRDSNLAARADIRLRPSPATEGQLLNVIADSVGKGTRRLKAAVAASAVDPDELVSMLDMLDDGKKLAVIVGPQIFNYGDPRKLEAAIAKLAALPLTFIPLYHGVNARGALELGVFNELRPGGRQLLAGSPRGPGLASLRTAKGRPKVLYLVGEVPLDKRPPCDYIIAQDTYQPPFEVDAFLPAASFAEAGGTFINLEGRVQELVQVEAFPDGARTGFERPDWKIFTMLARELGSKVQFASAAAVRKEIARTIKGFPTKADRKPRTMRAIKNLPPHTARKADRGDGEFLLVIEPSGLRHRGVDMATKVEGLGALALETGFRLNPADLTGLRLRGEGRITVSPGGKGTTLTGLAKADPSCPRGVVYITRPDSFGGRDDLDEWTSLVALRCNPLRVNITRAPTAKAKA